MRTAGGGPQRGKVRGVAEVLALTLFQMSWTSVLGLLRFQGCLAHVTGGAGSVARVWDGYRRPKVGWSAAVLSSHLVKLVPRPTPGTFHPWHSLNTYVCIAALPPRLAFTRPNLYHFFSASTPLQPLQRLAHLTHTRSSSTFTCQQQHERRMWDVGRSVTLVGAPARRRGSTAPSALG